MRPVSRRPGFYATLWVCLVLTSLAVQARQEPLRVLVLNSYEESSAPYFQPIAEFKKELQQGIAATIAFQHVDLRQRGTTRQYEIDETIAQMLSSRYADAAPQLVVAAGPPAVDFWIQHRDSTFPEARLIVMARESYLRQAAVRPGDAVVATQFSFTGAIDTILQLLPGTSRIVMVFGDSLSERTLAEGARQALAAYSDRFSLEFTNDLTIPEIQDRLADLADGSVVFYGIFSKDINGVSLQHFSGLSMARSSSRVPVFGAFDDQLGHGIVGGELIQVNRIGQEMAKAARALLEGTHVPGVWSLVELSTPKFDWRELQAWNIDPARLPPGSAVLFEPPGVWAQHAGWILGVAIFVLAQAGLLFILLVQKRQRRRAEFAHATLGRRLISAHEDERRLLARELHDDLSQRLARVAIDAGFARSSLNSGGADEVLQNLHSELAAISRDVHNLSYRLHPSLVDDLGLGPALSTEVERIQRQTDVPIAMEVGQITKELPSDISLCFFRVAQEAMQNALRHSGANHIQVKLEQKSGKLSLMVHDNGVGFDTKKAGEHFSLGLSSMRERANLVNASLEITSQPGSGTRVTLTAPIRGTGT
jgi:two-component sensor histidine kinase